MVSYSIFDNTKKTYQTHNITEQNLTVIAWFHEYYHEIYVKMLYNDCRRRRFHPLNYRNIGVFLKHVKKKYKITERHHSKESELVNL